MRYHTGIQFPGSTRTVTTSDGVSLSVREYGSSDATHTVVPGGGGHYQPSESESTGNRPGPPPFGPLSGRCLPPAASRSGLRCGTAYAKLIGITYIVNTGQVAEPPDELALP
jgi:hypothetical protein